jgi:hypothetical protein
VLEHQIPIWCSRFRACSARSTTRSMCYLGLPGLTFTATVPYLRCLNKTTLVCRPPPDYGSGGWGSNPSRRAHRHRFEPAAPIARNGSPRAHLAHRPAVTTVTIRQGWGGVRSLCLGRLRTRRWRPGGPSVATVVGGGAFHAGHDAGHGSRTGVGPDPGLRRARTRIPIVHGEAEIRTAEPHRLIKGGGDRLQP